MNTIITIALIVAALGFIAWLASSPRGSRLHGLANIGAGFHEENLTKLADAAIATRYFLVKFGSDAAHIAACAATADEPLGFCIDSPGAAEDPVAVQLLGATDDTMHAIANAAIAVGAKLYSAGNGKVQGAPTVAGVYWEVGTALTAAGADGDEIEVETIKARRVVVLVAFTAIATPVGSDAGTTQTLANALKTDLTALRTALATPASVQVL